MGGPELRLKCAKRTAQVVVVFARSLPFPYLADVDFNLDMDEPAILGHVKPAPVSDL